MIMTMKRARSIHDAVADVLAKYWLEENLYCGLNSRGILERLSRTGVKSSLRSVRTVLSAMKERGEVTTRDTAGDIWAYPKRPLLEPRDPLSPQDLGTYTRQLRLGGGQYDHRFFQRQVLDRYLQDPRYRVEESGAGGSLSVKDEYYLRPDTAESDKVGIQAFGIAYLTPETPAVTVPLVYLGRLSREHQRHWASYEIEDRLPLDRDYYLQSFEGEWVDRVSPFDATIAEMTEINTLCGMIGYPPLFRRTFDDEPIPGFCWMTKPTSAAFDNFIHILDKLISENINRDFFAADGISLREQVHRRGGEVETREKGTIRLLKEFLTRHMRLEEPEVVEQLLATLRDIRRRRQRPAHAITGDAYQRELLTDQRKIVNQAYDAVRSLRLMFMLHPKASRYVPPEWLQKGRIG